MGQSTSSTRIEIFGLILALLPSIPVHLGIDNVAVVNKLDSNPAGTEGKPPEPLPAFTEADIEQMFVDK